MKKFKELFVKTKFINTYGATETPQIVTYYVIDNDIKKYSNNIIPIGKPIDGFNVSISDRKIVIKSKYLADVKYKESNNVYNTGDYGYFDNNNNLVYQGRTLVKINGYRVDISVVENEILKLNYIKNVFIIQEYDYFSEKDQLFCNLIMNKSDIKEKSNKRHIFLFIK